MKWSIFTETLRRNWRGSLLWALGLMGYGLLSTLILPDPEGMQDMVSAMDAIPPFVWQIMGVPDISILATPLGFIALRFFLTALVLLSVWAILAGLSITVNDEARDISDMVFSLPVGRGQVVVEKMLGLVPFTVVIPLGGWLGLALGMQINPNAAADLGVLFQASLMLIPVMLLVMSLTALLGTVSARRGLVSGVAGGFLGVSFVLNSVGNIARSDVGTALQQASLFHHADATRMLLNGFPWIAALIMVGLALGLGLLASRLIDRRDLAS